MNGRRDAAAAPLLTLRPPAPRTTAGRCQLSGPSLGEGVGRCRRSWKWPHSRNEGVREVTGRREGALESERERTGRGGRGRKEGSDRERKRLNGCTATGLHPAPALVSGTPPASPRPFVRPHPGDGEDRWSFQRIHCGPRESEPAAGATAAAGRGSRGVAAGQLGSTPKQVDGEMRRRRARSTDAERILPAWGEGGRGGQTGRSRDGVEECGRSSDTSSFSPPRYSEQVDLIWRRLSRGSGERGG